MLYYSTNFNEKDRPYLTVHFNSDQELQMSEEELTELYDNFHNYLKDEKTEDIALVVANLRKIFQNIVEDELKITMKTNESYSEVTYLNGKFDKYYFKINDLNDDITIIDDYRGIDVEIKKFGTGFYNEEKTREIFNSVMKYYEVIYKLHELNYKEEKPKTKIK